VAALILSQAQREEVIEFICFSKENRRMAYGTVCKVLNLPIGPRALGRALEEEGYHRCLVLKKPPITEATELNGLLLLKST
jgi:hypothetical protein